MIKSTFHYAFKVKDLSTTRDFYVDLLGCEEGRSTETWIDFNFFGHQLSAHVSEKIPPLDYCGKVDGVEVPIPHFGCILSLSDFKSIRDKLQDGKVDFLIKPQERYQGQVGQQITMFVFDYSGNPLEFKTFANDEEMFSS